MLFSGYLVCDIQLDNEDFEMDSKMVVDKSMVILLASRILHQLLMIVGT